MTCEGTRVRAVAALFVLVVLARPSAQTPSSSPSAALRYRILVAEDARATTPAALAPIFEGLANPDARIVQMAVRALGHLERADFIPQLRRALTDSDARVRSEAANALGQVAAGRLDEVQRVLREHLAIEQDPSVRGTLCETLGRLPYTSADARRAVEPVLAEALGAALAPLKTRLGAARGIESLIRTARGSGFVASASTLTVLRQQVVAAFRPGGGEDEARTRRAALLALNATGMVDDTYRRAMFDTDAQVRRLVVAGVAGESGMAYRRDSVMKGLADKDPMVRYEALRVHGRTMAANDCEAQLAAVGDVNPHVTLLAIDQLATACPGDARATATLERLALVVPPVPVPQKGTTTSKSAAVGAPSPVAPPQPRRSALTGSPSSWHGPAHALVSLVRRDPSAADWRTIIDPLSKHSVWQVRMYAANAAGYVKDAAGAGGATNPAAETAGDLLEMFVADSNANVREAALSGLSRVRGHRADTVYIKALDSPDFQVVIVACRALRGASDRGATAEALLRVLKTITAQRLDTSRDARVAIFERLREVVDSSHADALTSYLSDFDPKIAGLAAEILTTLTGQAQSAVTKTIVPLPLPPAANLRSLPSLMRITLGSGRSFDVQLYVEEAPITLWRILRLASAGYYNGLTFHRIVPNFVIQGGSPGANEFVGDGPFMRDETSLRSNNRATIGVSTRGRDTGDAQFYINTVDSPRLDHEYAVFGEVVKGMEVVDLIVEGEVIKSVEVVGGTAGTGRK